ncbi:MAG TPA: diguanylate cyclase [Gammaproteobacteria bacterium]|nr:diguanylate cyclase [Gammaproteobacteria bacterium]
MSTEAQTEGRNAPFAPATDAWPEGTVRRFVHTAYLGRLVVFYVNGMVWPLVLGRLVFDSPSVWWLWGTIHLLWPHVAYVHALLARDKSRAGRINAILDVALFGVLANEIGYVIWYCLMFVTGGMTVNAAYGGLRQVLAALSATVIASLGWGMFHGFHYLGFGPLRVELAGAAMSVLPFLVAMYSTNRFVGALREAQQAIREKNRLFETLIQMGIATHGGMEIDELLRTALQQIHALMPDCGFGIVLRQPGRSRLIRHSSFLGVSEDQRARMLDALRGEAAAPRDTGAVSPERAGCRILSMSAHLSALEGFLLVAGCPRHADAETSLRLFTDQVGSALQSALLTGELRRIAETDSLTGLYNRGYYAREFEQAVRNREGAAGTEFSLIAVDLNGFKEINDAYGHAVGDRVLVGVAERLRRATRDSDALIRMGGDEFLVLCHMCDSAAVARVAGRIRRTFRSDPVDCGSSAGTPLSLEIGLSLGWASSDEVESAHLLQVADGRMYEDKQRYYASRGAAAPDGSGGMPGEP